MAARLDHNWRDSRATEATWEVFFEALRPYPAHAVASAVATGIRENQGRFLPPAAYWVDLARHALQGESAVLALPRGADTPAAKAAARRFFDEGRRSLESATGPMAAGLRAAFGAPNQPPATRRPERPPADDVPFAL
ncbi:MAG: hypothetical protein KGK07_07375 [Chloroflexota bacterium]|nr:hypothetical protein [Chloroflexota bacterium]